MTWKDTNFTSSLITLELGVIQRNSWAVHSRQTKAFLHSMHNYKVEFVRHEDLGPELEEVDIVTDQENFRRRLDKFVKDGL